MSRIIAFQEPGAGYANLELEVGELVASLRAHMFEERDTRKSFSMEFWK
jgi:hypothetical protein